MLPFKIDERTNRIVMMGAIDNMVKGAAGQAMQNMNLLFGLPGEHRTQADPGIPVNLLIRKNQEETGKTHGRNDEHPRAGDDP